MSELAGFDLDRSTARAWSRFQARLADHIADMVDDDILVVEAEAVLDEDDEGAAPYVQFSAWGEDKVRCEVSSNEYLAQERLLDHAGVRELEGLGWAAPTCGREERAGDGSPNFFVDRDRSDADRLAVMTVRALRDVFGVAHPAFLSAGDLTESDESATNLCVPSSHGDAAAADEPIAVYPCNLEDLRSLVDEALTPFFGHVPAHDEDGDVPVVSGSGLVFVRVEEQAPRITLFGAVVTDVDDPERARFEVGVLNRDVRFVKFALVEDRVMAYLHLPAWPFVPEHLRAMLAVMAEAVDDVDDDLATRVGGRRAFEPDAEQAAEGSAGEDDETQLHPAMATLLQLDAGSPGSVDPELAAGICGMDRDLLLELILWSSGQEIEWRMARDDAFLAGGREGEAEVCEHEMRHAERTTNLLRRALRLVVEREMGRSPGQDGYTGSERATTLPQSRRRPRRPQPGPDDQPPPEQLDLWS